MEKNKISPLNILTTGGTIDKAYDESEGTLENRETYVKNKILQKLRLPYADIKVTEIMAKDSLLMTDADREFILQAIQKTSKEGSPIVVLHGTDTMDLTSRYCFENFKDVPVAVVFTGAMKPLGFDDSDATQNVVEAIFAAKLMKPGFYVTFHGELYQVPNVRKNKQKGTFEEIP